MRAILGVLGLLIVVAIVGIVARKQLQAVAPVSVDAPAAGGSAAAVPVTQAPQQVKQDVERAMQGAAARASQPEQ